MISSVALILMAVGFTALVVTIATLTKSNGQQRPAEGIRGFFTPPPAVASSDSEEGPVTDSTDTTASSDDVEEIDWEEYVQQWQG